MSLKNFHLFFIAISLSLMAFLVYWSRANAPMLGASLLGLGAGAVYLGWFLRKHRSLA